MVKIVIANWKMNKTINEGLDYVTSFLNLKPPIDKVETVIAPSFVLIYTIFEAIKGFPIYLSAQNLSCEKGGPFTGEVSGEALKSVGCKYVIVGHSERRKLFSETDEIIYKKFKVAKSFNLIPVICFGEELEEYKEGKTLFIIENQLKNYFAHRDLVLAYEPVWSIGTDLIPKKHELEIVGDYVKEKFAHNATLLYGGSVNLSNIDKLVKVKNIDGFLVGGASLNPLTFAKIIDFSQG